MRIIITEEFSIRCEFNEWNDRNVLWMCCQNGESKRGIMSFSYNAISPSLHTKHKCEGNYRDWENQS